MKRKIAILLASVMTATMLPMSAIAATISPIGTSSVPMVQSGEAIGETALGVKPTDAATVATYKNNLESIKSILKLEIKEGGALIPTGTQFKISLVNGTFPADTIGKTNPEKFSYKNASWSGAAVKYVNMTEGNSDAITATGNFQELIQKINLPAKGDMPVPALPYVPYSITIDSETDATITTLSPISDADIASVKIPLAYKNAITDSVATAEPISEKVLSFAIPLEAVQSNGEGDVKVKVVSFDDFVTEGEYTIAKFSANGGTTTTVEKVQLFDESVTVNLNVAETFKNSIKNYATATGSTGFDGSGEFVTIRPTTGFLFDKSSTVKVEAGRNSTGVAIESLDIQDSKITFKLSGLTKNENTKSIKITGINVYPADMDKNYGDVDLTISGSGITESTVKVATREKVGVKMEVSGDVPTITAGRYYALNSNLNSKENNAAEVKFEQLVAGTLLTSRPIDFNVPEGVKIVDADFASKNISDLDLADLEIVNKGTTLRIKRNSYTLSDTQKLTMKLRLQLSIDPSFKGEEVKLSFAGGGIAAGAVADVVIAKVQSPFTVETKSTNVNIGYMDYATANIVLSENKPGMFMQDGKVVIKIKAPYSTGQIGFTGADTEISGNELKIKDFKRTNDAIEFTISESSYKTPGTITINNVKVGTTRSVPFGSFGLDVSGSAMINTYVNKDNIGETTLSFKVNSTDADDLTKMTERVSGITESYSFDDYIKIVTETGTLDYTVKVSVGEKAAVVGDKTLEMDVAPYIQATSNSTMVPLRFVSLALGVDATSINNPDASSKVSWDSNSKTATIYYGSGSAQKIIQFQNNSNKMIVDGTVIPMEYGVTAEVKDGRIFVPFRALGQALGVNVSWNPDTRTAIYNEASGQAIGNATTTETTTAKTSESSTESTTAKTSESSTETTTASK